MEATLQQIKLAGLSKLSTKTVLLKLSISVGSALSIIFLGLGIVQWIFGIAVLQNSGILGAYAYVVSGLFASALYVLLSVVVEGQKAAHEISMLEEGSDANLTDTLIAGVEGAFAAQRWEEVIKIGSVLSRPLWVTGKYHLRVRLGKLVEEAAAYSNKPDVQAAALIDDLGWTKHVLGETDEAKANIHHGITLAESQGAMYLVYKGYRHLFAIATDKGDINDARAHHDKALVHAERIPEEREREEALAGLHFNMAQLDLKIHDWDGALRELGSAQMSYERLHDAERIVKLFALRGDALYELGKYSDAKDVYRQGLEASRRESRRDGIVQNDLGLARIAVRDRDYVEARRAYEEAMTIERELGRESAATEIQDKLSQLPQHTR